MNPPRIMPSRLGAGAGPCMLMWMPSTDEMIPAKPSFEISLESCRNRVSSLGRVTSVLGQGLTWALETVNFLLNGG